MTSIEDSNNPGYMSHRCHTAYWGHKSMAYMASIYGLSLSEFEMQRPGSVIPDQKYGQLFPNKRVFFIYDRERHGDYFDNLKNCSPILPIDRP